MKMGATKFIATDEDKDWAKHNSRSIDIIVSTVSSPKMPLSQYLQLLKTKGKFIQVGAPEDALPGFNCFALIGKGISLSGSAIGPPEQVRSYTFDTRTRTLILLQIREMLDLTVEKKVKPWIQQRPLKDANQAIIDMTGGNARYRYVLVNESHSKL